MPWTETARRNYARRGMRYSSDLSDRVSTAEQNQAGVAE